MIHIYSMFTLLSSRFWSKNQYSRFLCSRGKACRSYILDKVHLAEKAHGTLQKKEIDGMCLGKICSLKQNPKYSRRHLPFR